MMFSLSQIENETPSKHQAVDNNSEVMLNFCSVDQFPILIEQKKSIFRCLI